MTAKRVDARPARWRPESQVPQQRGVTGVQNVPGHVT